MAENNMQVLPDGVKLNYLKWSAPNNNSKIHTPFLLLHGLASGSRIWDKVAAELLKITAAPIYALDQRGHGLSDKPDNGYTTAQIVEDVHAFAESQNLTSERPVIVGHSWGATIALAYAATYPDYVSGIALVDGGMGNMRGRPGMDNWEEVAKRLAPPDFAGTPRQTFLDYFRKGGQARFLAPVWNSQLEDMTLNIVELREDDTVAPRLSRQNHMQILRSMWETDNLAHAANIHSPVLMISAEPTNSPDTLPEDEQQAGFIKMKRKGAEQLKAALVSSPKAEFIIMSETIHDIPLQRPVELVNLFSQFFFEMS